MHWPHLKSDSHSTLATALGWCMTSEEMLEETENQLFAGVQSLSQGHLVSIGPVVDPHGDHVMTRWANIESTKTPLLLLHGFGVGSALWCMNIDALANDRPVYIIDLLGFGRSSRPTFSTEPLEAERQFVASIEGWRAAVGMQKLYLCGHSFGGYLSTLYATQHPDRVEHLVLLDPWGYPSKPQGWSLPLWAKPMEIGAACILPFFALRAAGPLGYLYLRMFPPLNTHALHNVKDASKLITDYFYHVNVRKPSGEKAFHCLMSGIAWAKLPMIERFVVPNQVPVTFIYGEHSWIYKSPGYEIQKSRVDSYVDIKVINGCGHAVNSEQPGIFNTTLRKLMRDIDTGAIPRNVLAPKCPGRPNFDANQPVLRPNAKPHFRSPQVVKDNSGDHSDETLLCNGESNRCEAEDSDVFYNSADDLPGLEDGGSNVDDSPKSNGAPKFCSNGSSDSCPNYSDRCHGSDPETHTPESPENRCQCTDPETSAPLHEAEEALHPVPVPKPENASAFSRIRTHIQNSSDRLVRRLLV